MSMLNINIEELLKELDPATLQEEKLFPATRRLCIYMIEYLRKKGLYRELLETLNEKMKSSYMCYVNTWCMNN